MGANSLWKVAECILLLLILLIVLLWGGPRLRRLSFKKLLLLIEEQTSYTFFYEEEIFKQARPVTIHREDATVEEILDEALDFQPKSFSYSINGKMIFLKRIPKKWRRE